MKSHVHDHLLADMFSANGGSTIRNQYELFIGSDAFVQTIRQ